MVHRSIVGWVEHGGTKPTGNWLAPYIARNVVNVVYGPKSKNKEYSDSDSVKGKHIYNHRTYLDGKTPVSC